MLAPPNIPTTPCKYGHTSGRNKEGKCYECLRLRSRWRYAKDLEKSRERARIKQRKRAGQLARDYGRKHYASNLRKYIFKAAVSRAKFLGFACTITEADIVIPEFCPLLGIKLRKGIGRAHAGSPSLDKIRPELGYVPGNVWVISYRANELKRDATFQELQTLVNNFSKIVRTYPWERV